MATYMVQIEASNAEGTIWQALLPAEAVEYDGTAPAVAEMTAANQNVADGDGWRVRVWEGAEATGEPAAEYYASNA